MVFFYIILPYFNWWHSQAVRQEPAKLPFLSSILSATLFLAYVFVLYLISTPLGNLKDITLRSLEILKECDLILCEDTRHSKVLLNHYEIKTPVKSLHKFNEQQELAHVLEFLQEGKTLALISDAGTPCIQDPGAILVKACLEHSIEVKALPGPCAFVTAMSLSGEEEGPFQFVGFFPKKEEALKKILLPLLEYEGHSLAYVSPHQLVKTLHTLSLLDENRSIFLIRELTKYYEESYNGTSKELYKLFKDKTPKGEFVIMIKKSLKQENFDNLSIPDHVAQLEKTYLLSKNEAIKLAAKQRGLSKRDIYNLVQKKP